MRMPSLWATTLVSSLAMHAGIGLGLQTRLEEPRAFVSRALAPDVWAGTTVLVAPSPDPAELPVEVERMESAPPAKAASEPEPAALPIKTQRVDAPPPAKAASESEPTVLPVKTQRVEAPTPVQVASELEPAATRRVEKRSPAEQRSEPKAAAASPVPPVSVDLRRAMADAVAHPSTSSGVFGSLGVDPNERDLARALSRAMPIATLGEAKWWERPVGELGRPRFDVWLDSNGRITDFRLRKPQPSRFVERLVTRMVGLLKMGRFAWVGSPEQPGIEGFEIRLVLQQTEAVDRDAEPGSLYQLNSDEAPRGRAWIREAGGRLLRGYLLRIPADPER